MVAKQERKTRETFPLQLLPQPRGRFTTEKARAWLDGDLKAYFAVATTSCGEKEGRPPRTRTWATALLLQDIESMIAACRAVIGGQQVGFWEGTHCSNFGVKEIAELLLENWDDDLCPDVDSAYYRALRSLEAELFRRFDRLEQREFSNSNVEAGDVLRQLVARRDHDREKHAPGKAESARRAAARGAGA